MFDVLGVRPAAGRLLGETDDAYGGGANGPVAVIGYSFWQRRFGGGLDVIGRRLVVQSVPFTVVGIMPPAFTGPEVGRSADVVIPIGTERLIRGAESFLDGRSTWWLEIIARLKPGQSVEQATAALRGAQPQIRDATLPPRFLPGGENDYLKEPFTLTPAAGGSSPLREKYQRPLTIMMVVVAAVLLVACANIANLMLARATARRHELVIRLALGASRLRLARQFLLESLMLAGSGALLGLVLARGAVAVLLQQLSTPNTRVYLDTGLDLRVLGFTAGVAGATAILFGVMPALSVAHTSPNEALKEQGRSVTSDRRFGARNALVVAQVALSLVLVVAAGLFVRTFTSLSAVGLGFEPNNLLLIDVNLLQSAVPADERVAALGRLREAIAAVPGVTGAALSWIAPVSGSGWNTVVEQPGSPQVRDRARMSWLNAVSPTWFSTYGLRLTRGRDFTDDDRAGQPRRRYRERGVRPEVFCRPRGARSDVQDRGARA